MGVKLGERHRLKVVESELLRWIFGLRRQEDGKHWTMGSFIRCTLHQTKENWWMCHVTRTGTMRNAFKMFVWKP